MPDPHPLEGGERAGMAGRNVRRAAAALGGGLVLVLVVATVAGSDSRRSELAPAWGDDPEVAKMQSTIDSLTKSLDHTKEEIRRADAKKAALQAQRRDDVQADAVSKKLDQQSEHALRDVYAKPERYSTSRAMAVEKAVERGSMFATSGKAAQLFSSALARKPMPEEQHAASAKHGMVSLKGMNSLTAALKVLEDDKGTPAHTRKMAASALSEVMTELEGLESGVDCSRKSEYDKMLSNFGELLEQLQKDNATQAEVQRKKKGVMDSATAEYMKIEKAYNDSTARLAEAEAHAKEAHDNFVKYKTLVSELKKELEEAQKQMSTVGEDSKRTLAGVANLRSLIDEMQSAIDTGEETTYAERLMSATQIVDNLPISDQEKNTLRTGLKSPAKPKEMTADALSTIETAAHGGAQGLSARIAKLEDSLREAQKLYNGYQMDYITFSTDVDLQKDLQRAAHAEINELDGKRMAATMAYEAWEQGHRQAVAASAAATAATQAVIAKLAEGLAACGGGAAAADVASPEGRLLAQSAAKIRSTGIAAIHALKQEKLRGGKKAATKAVPTVTVAAGRRREAAEGHQQLKAHGQQLTGDPVLYKEPADINDKSVVEGILSGAYPAGPPDDDAFNSAVAEAGIEHAKDEPGVGMPKDAQVCRQACWCCLSCLLTQLPRYRFPLAYRARALWFLNEVVLLR